MQKRILILAGEASGDLQGAFLIKELKKLNDNFVVSGIGGRLLKETGADILYDTTSLGVVGPWNAISKIPYMLKIFSDIKKYLLDYRPDLVLMIDSPALNMRMGKFAKAHGFKTLYFFPPSAWYPSVERVRKVASVADYIIPVFDYNVKTYESSGVPYYCFGHPIVDVVAAKMKEQGPIDLPEDKIFVAFLPGSRFQEIKSLMKVFIKAMRKIFFVKKDVFFLIPAASKDIRLLIEKDLKSVCDIPYKILDGGGYGALKHSSAAVVASGTATLEASVIGVPMVVVYKLAWPDWIIGKLFVKVPYFALPNLILQKRAVCELLQTQVTPERLLKEVLSILDDSSKRAEILSYLLEVRKTLGEPGSMAKIASFVNSVLLGEI